MFRLSYTVRAGIAAALLTSMMGGSAVAQVQANPAAARGDRVEERLIRLENQLRDLQGALYSVEGPQRPLGGTQNFPSGAVLPPDGPSAADTSIRVLQLEQSIAELTGRVEELAYRLERQQEIIERLEGAGSPEFGAPSRLPGIDGIDNPDRGTTGGPVDLLSGEDTGEPEGPMTPSVMLPDDPDRAYDEAYQSVLAADYETAEAKLEAFVAKFPEATQTAEAKFMLGEIYLATGANGEAARIFLDHVSNYKDDPRSPEAYLKLGIAFTRLNRPEEACRVFNAGLKKFPNMEQRLATKYAEERAAAVCN